MKQLVVISLLVLALFVLPKIVFADIDYLKKITTSLSSPDFQGRKMGMLGERDAAEFLAIKLGLIDGVTSLSNFGFELKSGFEIYNPELSPSNTRLSINGRTLKLGEEFLPIIISAPTGSFNLEQTILLNCDYSVETGFQVLQGKTVLIREADCNNRLLTDNKERALLELLHNIDMQKPSAIVVVAKGESLYRPVTTWEAFLDPELKAKWLAKSKDIPMAVVDSHSTLGSALRPLNAPAFYVKKSVFLAPLQQNYKVEGASSIIPDYKNGINVIAQIKGRSNKYILISAHYDGYGAKDGNYNPGANDNASGVASVLSLTKALAERYNTAQPEVGLIVAFFSGEEWGLLGSQAFVEVLAQKNLTSKIIANINIDTVGGGDASNYYMLGKLANPELLDFIESFNPENEELVFNHQIDFAYFRGTDHFSFHQYEIPAIDITSGMPPEMHTPLDTADKLNYVKLERLTKYLFKPLTKLMDDSLINFPKSKKAYAPYPGSRIMLHDIKVIVNPADGTFHVEDQFGYNQKIKEFSISPYASNLRLEFDGLSIPFKLIDNLVSPDYPPIAGSLKVSYDVVAPPMDPNAGMDHNSNGVTADTIVVNEGVYLDPMGNWYPSTDLYENIRMKVELPSGWTSMVSGKLLSRTNENGVATDTWLIDYPSERVHLIAGQFEIRSINYRGVSLETYFHASEAAYSAKYLEQLKGFLDLYLDMYGSYPYAKFAVVSNFFSTGYGMPSYTLLDKNIIAFPFIVGISLGHELLHNYWGNSIYVEGSDGNWCEGLTVYHADYLYELQKSATAAREYRAGILRDYQNFVNYTNVFPLEHFVNRVDSASRAIGYGKGMMFFYMLERLVGTQTFNKVLSGIIANQSFQEIGFIGFRDLMEKATGKNLQLFFEQWIKRIDLPVLAYEWQQSSSSTFDSKVVINLKIRQKNYRPYELTAVPLRFTYDDGSIAWRNINITQMIETFIFDEANSVIKVELDPDFMVMRDVTMSENPPALNVLFGQTGRSYFSSLPNEAELNETLLSIISNLPETAIDPQLKRPDWTDAQNLLLDQSAIYFIKASDLKQQAMKKLLASNPSINLKDDTLSFNVDRAPFSTNINEHGLVIARRQDGRSYIIVSIPEGWDPYVVASKLMHYGKYGFLSFDKNGKKEAALIIPQQN